MTDSVLFLGKEGDEGCIKAAEFIQANFGEARIYMGDWGDCLPDMRDWHGDFLISYLSRWVIPQHVFDSVKDSAINFHPGPPEYPGFGCYNFALYEGAQYYGVTCHHMNPVIDTGEIIAARRFVIYDSDDVASLIHRTYDYLLVLFYEIMGYILAGHPFPASNEFWARDPITKDELEALHSVSEDMSNEEIRRRIRATSYGKYQPAICAAGHRFEYKGVHEHSHL